jgi:ATP-dependent Clp protease adapter protein ClpS
MKHMVTSLNDPNEPMMFSNSILGNFCFKTFFGELEAKISPYVDSNE